MVDQFTFLCPLPQLRLDGGTERYDFEPNLSVRSISLSEQRSLINVAKASRRCSDWLLASLHDARVMITSPARRGKDSMFFRLPFETLVRRFLECFILVDGYRFIPPPIIGCASFLVPGSSQEMAFDRALVLEADWRPDGMLGEFLANTRFDAAPILKELRKCWPRIAHMCGIETLDGCLELKDEAFCDLIEAGNESVRNHAQETSDAFVSEYGDHLLDPEFRPLQITIPDKRSASWFLKGFGEALVNEISKRHEKWRADLTRVRLQRAFEIFLEASHLREPQRFVNLITSLESLLSTGTSELTSQLAIRTAWLMEPSTLRMPEEFRVKIPNDKLQEFEEFWRASSPNRRWNVHQEISDMYGLRSKIVHGEKFDFSQLTQKSNELSLTVKSLFRQIIEDQILFDLFMDSDDKNLKQHLKKLPLQG